VHKLFRFFNAPSTWALSGVFPAGFATVNTPFRWLKLAPPPTMNSQASAREAPTLSPLYPKGVVRGLIEFNGLVVPVFIIESLHSTIWNPACHTYCVTMIDTSELAAKLKGPPNGPSIVGQSDAFGASRTPVFFTTSTMRLTHCPASTIGVGGFPMSGASSQTSRMTLSYALTFLSDLAHIVGLPLHQIRMSQSLRILEIAFANALNIVFVI